MNRYKCKNFCETIIVVLTTLSVFAFMLIPVKSSEILNALINGMMLISILYGIATSIIEHKRIDKGILLLTMAYFCARLASYIINKVPITYGGSLMIQVFYLVGINRALYSSKKRLKTVIYLFIAFETIAVLMCYVNNYFRKDYVSKLVLEYADKGITAETNMFQNPNTAGLIVSAAIILCLTLIINRKEIKTCLISIPILVINIYMLFHDTGCRAAQTGLIVTVLIIVAITAIKRIDSIRVIICAALLFCMLLLIPLFTTVYWGNNEEYLGDVTSVEQHIDKASSGRYAIWKATILSQEGHFLLGFGGHANAVNKRMEFIDKCDPERLSEYYKWATIHGSVHNGYLTMVVEAGVIGTVILLLLLLRRAWMLKGRFRDGNWHYMLLIYIFWVNLFEAKFINAIFFTGFLMMVLLMPNEEEDKNEYKIIPEATKKEIEEAV